MTEMWRFNYMNDLEQLDYTLENGSPILLLGSGFSLGATNAKGSLVWQRSCKEAI